MANNDMDNQDFEPDFDQDVDFDEFGDTQSQSVSNTISSSPVLKIALGVAAVLVVVGAIALFGGEKQQTLNSRVGGGAPELAEAAGSSEVSQVMRGALEEDNQKKLEDALKTGSSAIPRPIDPPKVLLDVPENETTAEDPLVRWKRLQEERIRLQREQEQFSAQAQEDPEKGNRIAQLRQAMIAQAGNIMSDRASGGMQNIKVFTADQQLAAGGGSNSLASLQGYGQGLIGQQGVGATNGTAATATPLEPLKIIVPAGEIFYSQLMMEANSDVPGPIMALLVSGPFKGSRIIGSFSKKEEYLVLNFTTLVGKDGHSIPINALAIDPDTTLGAMATDVDHRYWRRVILPAAASFVQGMGDAIAENGSTSVTVNGDTTVSQESSDLDTEQEISKAAAEAASKVGDILDDNADVPILVKVKAGTPMGIMFTTPVTDRDVESSKYGGVSVQNGQPVNGLPVNGYPGQADNSQNPLQLLQQGLNNQNFLQQTNNPYGVDTSATQY